MTVSRKGALWGSFLEEERIDCNASSLDEALGSRGLPCVGQEIKLPLSQGQAFSHAAWAEKTLGCGPSEQLSHLPPWSVAGASHQPPGELSPEELIWQVHIYFPHLEGPDTRFHIDADKILWGSVTPYHLCLKFRCLSCPGWISEALWKFTVCGILHRARATLSLHHDALPWSWAPPLSSGIWRPQGAILSTYSSTSSFPQYDINPSICQIKRITNWNWVCVFIWVILLQMINYTF